MQCDRVRSAAFTREWWFGGGRVAWPLTRHGRTGPVATRAPRRRRDPYSLPVNENGRGGKVEVCTSSERGLRLTVPIESA
jgi:hypothetical protein